MFSEMIRDALEREVVGQEEAVNSVARGLTRLASQLTPAERSWCAYLLMGPAGTGRGHLVRTVARVLHGCEDVLTINCRLGGLVDPWVDFLRRLEPLAAPASGPLPGGVRAPRLILVQDLERAPKEVFPQLAYLLESGQETLGGSSLRLDGCMLFFTTGLCSDQILDEARIGFPGTARDGTGGMQRICLEESEKVFGRELMGQLDDLVVFHQLDADRLSEVLDRHFARMERWLEERGIHCVLGSEARSFLLGSADEERRSGAHQLVRIHRDEVEFPIADLLLSGALDRGDRISIDHRGEEPHLHFSVDESRGRASGASEVLEIPVVR